MQRDLRRRSTAAEVALWEALRDRRLDGLKFRRQHGVGPFVLDFFCAAHKLVIEVDGPIHDEQVEQDAYRSAHLTQYGYRVIRFCNEEVLDNLSGVLDRIKGVCFPGSETRGVSTSSLSHDWERGGAGEG